MCREAVISGQLRMKTKKGAYYHVHCVEVARARQVQRLVSMYRMCSLTTECVLGL